MKKIQAVRTASALARDLEQPKENAASPIESVPVEIRRAVLLKQLEQYGVQAADNFGAYEVTLTLQPSNRKQLQHYTDLMNQALAAASRIKELIAELPVEVKQ